MSATHAANPSPRIILSAYQCAPGQGSVSQIGWEWYSRLSRRLPVTLVTHARNRQWIHDKLAPGADVMYIDTEWFAGPLYRTAKRLFRSSEHAVFMISSLDYFVFDRAARNQLAARMKAGETWDVVHQVTPVSPLAASSLHRLGLPMVLGPWNGGLGTPKEFPEFMMQDAAWLYPLRRLGNLADLALRSRKHAAAILSATAATDGQLTGVDSAKVHRMLENAVDLSRFRVTPWPEAPSQQKPLEILFVGRLVPAKGVPMLLDAIAAIRNFTPVRLNVIGDGPLRDALEQQSQQLHLNGTVRFEGNQPAARVADAMAEAHVLCLPSVRESGGGVLLEAMACGRPVIGVNFGGPAEIVDREIGALLPATGRRAVVDGLIHAFRDICSEPERWAGKARAAYARAEELYSWDAKMDAAERLYQGLLRCTPAAPNRE
jgi:glycosyltransferase involved in cell wall biosynthesis